MTAQFDSFRLRVEFQGHDADVRGAACSAEGSLVATASRDSTVALWSLGAHTGICTPLSVLRGHDHFVNTVTFAESRENLIVSASSDHCLRVWEVNSVDGDFSSKCVAVLKGHTGNICHVKFVPGSSPKIVSCSWDMTARIWDLSSYACVHVLKGHEAAVWGALALADGRLITVSADKTVRLWDLENYTHAVLPSVHTDVIRSVTAAPNGGFITVSNDSTAVYWTPSGRTGFQAASQLQNLHDGSFAYSVAGFKELGDDGDEQWLFVSGGEDNAARVFILEKNTGALSCVQTIVHPGVVWCVAFASNGDIVTGCSDGKARAFTRNAALVADNELLQRYAKDISERQINTKVIGNVDVAKLPTIEEGLSAPGRKDGENKMIRTNTGSAEVHMWSANESQWIKVGDIVDAPGGASMGGGDVKGKHYDFAFDVELGEGGRKEKLGFNRGENVYIAAQRFIDDNDLSPEFLDQIVNFVESQVPPDALSVSGSYASDPLTGESRYVPGRSSDAPVSNGFGGTTQQERGVHPSSNVQTTTSSNDKLPLPPPKKYIPHPSGIVSYTTSDQIVKIQAKLTEINSELSTKRPELSLTQEEADVFGAHLIPKLKLKADDSSVMFTDEECAVVRKMLDWPTTSVFPVLDIARLVICRPSAGAYFFGKHNGEVLSIVLRHMSSPESSDPVLIMGCRFLCNLFGNRVVASATRSRCSEILVHATRAAKSDSRRARETFASLLVNYAVALHDAVASAEERSIPLEIATKLLISGEKEEEVSFRLLVAIGTLMCGGDEMVKNGMELGAATAATAVASLSARIQQVAHEIAVLIAS